MILISIRRTEIKADVFLWFILIWNFPSKSYSSISFLTFYYHPSPFVLFWRSSLQFHSSIVRAASAMPITTLIDCLLFPFQCFHSQFFLAIIIAPVAPQLYQLKIEVLCPDRCFSTFLHTNYNRNHIPFLHLPFFGKFVLHPIPSPRISSLRPIPFPVSFCVCFFISVLFDSCTY